MTTSVETVPEMIYAVSHDLGEPIREILGFAQLIAQRSPENTEQQFWDDLGHVEGGALRARAMLAALCDFIRTEELEPETAEVDLAELFDGVMLDTAAIRAAYASTVHGSLEGRAATYPVVLREVLTELVSNAARFGTSADGTGAQVTVEVTVDDDSMELVVEDRGPGIPEDARQRALQLFQRLHRRTDHDTLGAGLAIVRRKIERCGGHIALGSPELTEGLRVSVSMPIPVIDLRHEQTPVRLAN